MILSNTNFAYNRPKTIKKNMDACEIANFLANELFMQQLVSVDGMQTGVPTLTTSTLTPTTLRNIEQTFIELTADTHQPSYLAGFVPPIVPSNFQENSMGGSSDSGSQSSWQTPLSHEENSTATTDNSNAATIHTNGSPSLPTASCTPVASSTGGTRRNVGGRRPNKPSNLSPEEEEKRKIRRERNKLAAARCRKRRVDQTNDLLEKVAELEREKEGLKKNIEELSFIKDDIEMCLAAHRSQCRLQTNIHGRVRSASPLDIKPITIIDTFDVKTIKDEPIDSIDSLDGPPSPKRRMMMNSNNPSMLAPLPNVSTISATIASATAVLNTPTSTTAPPNILTKPNRPSSLNVPLTITPSQAFSRNVADIAGVPITTPSTGTFNFDSLMDGGTGLTPVSNLPLLPTCSSQNHHPLELKTPTSEPSKLVSL